MELRTSCVMGRAHETQDATSHIGYFKEIIILIILTIIRWRHPCRRKPPKLILLTK